MTPRQRPPSLPSAVAEAPSRTSIPASASTSSARREVIARPVSLPPAWTIRRAEWPPSSPSARLPPGSRSKATPRLSSCSTAAAAPSVSALDGARPAEAAPGGERVGRVALGRVVGRERGGEPALGPEARALGERLARDEDDARSLGGRFERDVEAGGAASDDGDVTADLVRSGQERGTVPGSMIPIHARPNDARVPRWIARTGSPVPPGTRFTRPPRPLGPVRPRAHGDWESVI